MNQNEYSLHVQTNNKIQIPKILNIFSLKIKE